jgi:S1-C subfamily serine protease
MTARVFSRLVPGLLAVLCLGGCGAVSMSPSMDRAVLKRKAPSLAAWHESPDNRQNILKGAEFRTALLPMGWDTVTVSSNSEVAFSGWNGAGFGSAVPVTADGYFLTAAHCVNAPRKLKVLTLNQKLHLEQAPARVVWRGQPTFGGADLALIHAPLKPVGPFALTDPAALRPGDTVALAGWSKLGLKTKSGAAAGQILAVSKEHREAGGFSWRLITHNAPFNSGDSGGPLIAPDGGLVAINAQIMPSPLAFLRAAVGWNETTNTGYVSRAFAPDRAWLERMIKADRAAQAATPLAP